MERDVGRHDPDRRSWWRYLGRPANGFVRYSRVTDALVVLRKAMTVEIGGITIPQSSG